MPVEGAILQRIAAAVTPAVMVSACGLLALGLDNQAARMTTRLRDLAREFRSATEEARRQFIREEAAILTRRHGLYVGALLGNYGALLAFLLTSLFYLAEGLTGWPVTVPLFCFGLGVALLAGCAVFTLLSIWLSRRAIALELRDVAGAPK